MRNSFPSKGPNRKPKPVIAAPNDWELWTRLILAMLKT